MSLPGPGWGTSLSGHSYTPLQGLARKDFGGGTHGLCTAPVEEQQPVGKPGGEVEVVGDQKQGESVGPEFSQQMEELHLESQVEAGGGFVEEEDRGLLGERAGDSDALALPAREFPELAFGEGGDQATLQRPLDNGLVPASGAFPRTQVRVPPHPHHLTHRHRKRRRFGLRHHGKRAGPLPVCERSRQRALVEAHLALAVGRAPRTGA